MSTRIIFILFCVASLREARSADITMPEGLVPGDSYRIAFVTSEHASEGRSGDISDSNRDITKFAASGTLTARLDTTWTAIASAAGGQVDAPIDARDNTMTNPEVYGAGVPIYLPDGVTRIANDYRDLWDGSIANQIDLDASGHKVVSVEVRTGTEPDGTASPGFAFGAVPFAGGFGPPSTMGSNSPSRNWISSGTRPSAAGGSLYGMSGVVSVVPEPSSTALVGLAMLCVAAFRRRSTSNRFRA